MSPLLARLKVDDKPDGREGYREEYGGVAMRECGRERDMCMHSRGANCETAFDCSPDFLQAGLAVRVERTTCDDSEGTSFRQRRHLTDDCDFARLPASADQQLSPERAMGPNSQAARTYLTSDLR